MAMASGRGVFGRQALVLLALGFAALLGVAAGVAWLVDASRGFAEAVARTQEVRVASLRVLSLLQDAETSQRGFILTGEESYLGPYRAAVAELPAAIPRLAELVARDGGGTEAAEALRRLADEKLAELAETVGQTEAGNREGALAVVRTDRGRLAMDAIRGAVAGIEARSTERLAARSRALARVGDLLLAGAALAVLLIAAITAGVVALARRSFRALQAAQAEVEAANASLEERVADRTRALTAANEEVQRFAYIVSHDLRAPLVNVMGFTSELEAAVEPLAALLTAAEAAAPALVTAEARAAVAEDLPEAIGFIRSSTERMDRLINAILRLSREGRRALASEPVNLGALAGTLADTLRHQLDERGAEIRIEPGLPTIASDRLAVEQILGNLLDNAVKYLDPARPGRIVVRGRRRRGWVEVEVADNGRGIDPRDHARIFELFRRSGRQDVAGEGIGLAHVRALARRLGGDVECRSALGTGSTFTVTLPLVTQTVAATEETPA